MIARPTSHASQTGSPLELLRPLLAAACSPPAGPPSDPRQRAAQPSTRFHPIVPLFSPLYHLPSPFDRLAYRMTRHLSPVSAAPNPSGFILRRVCAPSSPSRPPELAHPSLPAVFPNICSRAPPPLPARRPCLPCPLTRPPPRRFTHPPTHSSRFFLGRHEQHAACAHTLMAAAPSSLPQHNVFRPSP